MALEESDHHDLYRDDAEQLLGLDGRDVPYCASAHYFKLWAPALTEVDSILRPSAEVEKKKKHEPYLMDWQFKVRDRKKQWIEPVLKDGKCATLKDVFDDVVHYVTSLRDSIERMMSKAEMHGYAIPAHDIAVMPTRSLQDILTEIFL
ncbi:hypothetical protein N0V94_001408 [Neodidymelliopsis sp. IMI 364377]|nr:hypothetical protein N0V94_001408 [Neodidymelliopsis sp. IMI 364377]